MLDDLAEIHPAFARWNRKATTRAAANRPAWAMPPDLEELTDVFEKGRYFRDEPREPWPELGFSVSAWDGREPPYGATLTVRPGAYTDLTTFPNTAELRLNAAGPGNANLITGEVLKPALLSLTAAWEPDYAVVTSWGYWDRSFGDRGYPAFRSGWMTWLAPQYASRITPPPAAIVERAASGGLLLVATAERFSMDNPAHLAVADAIQASLAPLQGLVPPGRHAHLRRRPNS